MNSLPYVSLDALHACGASYIPPDSPLSSPQLQAGTVVICDNELSDAVAATLTAALRVSADTVLRSMSRPSEMQLVPVARVIARGGPVKPRAFAALIAAAVLGGQGILELDLSACRCGSTYPAMVCLDLRAWAEEVAQARRTVLRSGSSFGLRALCLDGMPLGVIAPAGMSTLTGLAYLSVRGTRLGNQWDLADALRHIASTLTAVALAGTEAPPQCWKRRFSGLIPSGLRRSTRGTAVHDAEPASGSGASEGLPDASSRHVSTPYDGEGDSTQEARRVEEGSDWAVHGDLLKRPQAARSAVHSSRERRTVGISGLESQGAPSSAGGSRAPLDDVVSLARQAVADLCESTALSPPPERRTQSMDRSVVRLENRIGVGTPYGTAWPDALDALPHVALESVPKNISVILNEHVSQRKGMQHGEVYSAITISSTRHDQHDTIVQFEETPICLDPMYRDFLVWYLPALIVLDGRAVSHAEVMVARQACRSDFERYGHGVDRGFSLLTLLEARELGKQPRAFSQRRGRLYRKTTSKTLKDAHASCNQYPNVHPFEGCSDAMGMCSSEGSGEGPKTVSGAIRVPSTTSSVVQKRPREPSTFPSFSPSSPSPMRACFGVRGSPFLASEAGSGSGSGYSLAAANCFFVPWEYTPSSVGSRVVAHPTSALPGRTVPTAAASGGSTASTTSSASIMANDLALLQLASASESSARTSSPRVASNLEEVSCKGHVMRRAGATGLTDVLSADRSVSAAAGSTEVKVKDRPGFAVVNAFGHAELQPFHADSVASDSMVCGEEGLPMKTGGGGWNDFDCAVALMDRPFRDQKRDVVSAPDFPCLMPGDYSESLFARRTNAIMLDRPGHARVDFMCEPQDLPRQMEYNPNVAHQFVFGTENGDLIVMQQDSLTITGACRTGGGLCERRAGESMTYLARSADEEDDYSGSCSVNRMLHAQHQGMMNRGGDASPEDASRSRPDVLGLSWLNKEPTKFVAGTDTGTVHVYDVEWMAEGRRGGCVRACDVVSHLTSLHVNSDDRQYVVSGNSQHVRLFDLATGVQVEVLRDVHDEHINVVKFAHHNPHVLVTSSFDKYVRMWDLREARPDGLRRPVFSRLSRDGNVMVCFSPDDERILVSAVDNEVVQYTADGRKEHEYSIPTTGSASNYTRSYYMNGRDYLITGSCKESVIRVYNAKTGQYVREIELDSQRSGNVYVQSLRANPHLEFDLCVLLACQVDTSHSLASPNFKVLANLNMVSKL